MMPISYTCFREVGADQWIIVRDWPDGMPKDEDVIGLQKDWKSLLLSGDPINPAVITDLAKRHRITGGNWIFFTDTSYKAQLSWNKVVMAMAEKRLRSQTADVSQCDRTGEHVICVYNRDFTDQEQVYELDAMLRAIGIRTQMLYKPNVYTYLEIYKGNEWGIRPTIYRSDYVILDESSRISPLSSGPDPSYKPADSWKSRSGKIRR